MASFIFFAWGGVSFTLILIISITANYFFGLAIESKAKQSYFILSMALVFNLALLGVFKYCDFFIENINQISSFFSWPSIEKPGIVLPVGISFYTFHSISYLVDIYKGKCKAQKNIFNLALYIAMFSQLIAGPIIRYSDVWQQLLNRQHSIQNFTYGIERFIIGLSKKILLANQFAKVADSLFNSNLNELGTANAWLGISCYTLQIYFDFSGYSDMAIGLGHMFGFDFKENFNIPYSAKSIKDFWRRWHISLSTFFRDYVYIPLGGNQVSVNRTYLNLILVFFLTGFWHGASWTFVVWGLYHGAFLIIERLGFEKFLAKIWSPIANLYVILVVMIGWVLFRSDSFEAAKNYLTIMFHFKTSREQFNVFFEYLNPEIVFLLLIGIIISIGWHIKLTTLFQQLIEKTISVHLKFACQFILNFFYFALLIICTLYLVSGSYNPFIYYRF